MTLKLKLYAVVVRKTKSDDDVEIFATKRSAKAFVRNSLQAYIEARNKESARKLTIDDIQSYKDANGEGYSVYYGSCGGDYVTSARLTEKEI